MSEQGDLLATVAESTERASYHAAPSAPRESRRGRVAPTIVTLVAIGAALAALLPLAGYRPMWDGFVYAEAINDAATSPFSLGTLRLAGHASQAYAAVAIPVQRLAPGSTWPLFALSVLLLGIAAAGFARLIAHLFPGPDLAVERALGTASFLFQPAMLAAVVQPGLDLPLIPAFIWAAAFLLERRFASVIALGIVLAFTKETGLLLYGALVASYVAWRFVNFSGTLRERAAFVLRFVPLIVPALVFGAYLLYRARTAPPGEAVVWNAGTAMIRQSLVRQLLVPRIDRYLASYLAIALILNFGWIATVTIAVAAVARGRRLWRAGFGGARRELARMGATGPALIVGLALVTGYLLTRFATYANSRYLLPLMPLRDVTFVAALLVLPVGFRARRAVLGVYAALLFVSAVRTVDPVSKALYGTFAFGRHPMLRMTRVTHECCGPGRDQLVYDLEFAKLEALTNSALASIKPGDSTMVVLPDSTNWFLADRLVRLTSDRTVARDNTVAPLVVESDSAAHYAGRTRHAMFVALPNASVTIAMAQLAEAFQIGRERRLRCGGYWLSIYELTERSLRRESRPEAR